MKCCIRAVISECLSKKKFRGKINNMTEIKQESSRLVNLNPAGLGHVIYKAMERRRYEQRGYRGMRWLHWQKPMEHLIVHYSRLGSSLRHRAQCKKKRRNVRHVRSIVTATARAAVGTSRMLVAPGAQTALWRVCDIAPRTRGCRPMPFQARR